MLELLAPAGNFDALRSAVKGGANAVYLGLSQFNARMKADNFTAQNISAVVDYCHLHRVKVYVTLNISIKQGELKDLPPLLIACESAGVDAFIITDLSVMTLANKYAPHVALHASTQLGVHNILGAKYAERLGFKRVVLSRESKLEDIREIKENTNLEIEYFVHGAMCVSFSGGCLFSSVATGNSGNRGQCLQPCRKEYVETLTGQKGYMLSPKDQCLIEHLPELKEAGVTSLKIEGRMKSAAYVGLVVSKYRRAIDGHKPCLEDYSQLKRVYNRGGFNSGYAFSPKREIMCSSVQGHTGEEVAKILSCQRRKDYYILTVKSRHAFINGDGVKVFREGGEVGGFEISVLSVKGDIYELYSKKQYISGDRLHLTTDKSLTLSVLSWKENKLTATISAVIDINSVVKLIARHEEFEAEITDNTPLACAVNQPLSRENVIQSMAKSGDTAFEVDRVDVDIIGDIFMPKSTLNNLRRRLLDRLESVILDGRRNTKVQSSIEIKPLKYKKLSKISICNPDIADIGHVIGRDVDLILDIGMISAVNAKYGQISNNIYVKLPKVQLTDDLKLLTERLSGLSQDIGIYADNIYALELARQTDRCVLGGLGLNIYNSEHATRLGLTSYVASTELSSGDLSLLAVDKGNIAVYSYGFLPVMTFAHCPVQNITGCDCDNCLYQPFSLLDRYGEYQIRREKYKNCYFTMYNSSCHNLSNVSEVAHLCQFIDFSLDKSNGKAIIDSYLSCKKIDNGVKYTVGNIFRGVK